MIPETTWAKELEFVTFSGHDSSVPNYTARLALKLMEHFSIIAGDPDGEDSAGRARLKLLTPERVAERACTIAEQMVKEIDRRGWFIATPPLEKREPRAYRGRLPDGGPDLPPKV